MKEILKAFFKSGGGSALTIIFGVITTKIIAYYTGPTGVGFFSLLRQINQTAITIGTLSGVNAIVQGISSLKDQNLKFRYQNTVGTILIIFSLILSILIFLFGSSICKFIFDNPNQVTVDVFKWLVAPTIFGIGTSYFSAVLNANKAIGRLALVQVFSSGISSIVAYPIIKKFGFPWSLYFILFCISFTGLITSYSFSKSKNIYSNSISWKPDWDKSAVRHFISFAGVSSVAGIFGMLVVLLIRSIVVRNMGLNEAGIFDVAWTLSNTYIMLVLSSLGMYFLPTLAGKYEKTEAAELINQVLFIILIFVTPIILCVVTLKPLVIKLFYTKEFFSSLKIIRWMLIGDYLKAASWVLAMPMLAYGDLKRFLISEILANTFLFVCSSIAVVFYNSLEMIGAAFLAMYVLYFGYCIYYYHKNLTQKLNKNVIYIFIFGLGTIGIATIVNWNLIDLNTVPIIFCLLLALGFVLILLKVTKINSIMHVLAFLKKGGG